jgi:hypothetical protein
MDMKIGRRYIPALVAIVVVVVGAVTASIINPQNGPAIGNGGATNNCSTLTPSQTQVLPVAITQIAILFDCSTYGFEGQNSLTQSCITTGCAQTPAFTIPGGTYNQPNVSPSGGYNKIFFYPRANSYPFPSNFNGVNCASVQGIQIFGPNITPIWPHSVSAGEYNYCAEVTTVPNNGLSTFTVTWN